MALFSQTHSSIYIFVTLHLKMEESYLLVSLYINCEVPSSIFSCSDLCIFNCILCIVCGWLVQSALGTLLFWFSDKSVLCCVSMPQYVLVCACGVFSSRDSRMKKAAHRILNVWEERSVFDELFINELRLTLGEQSL